jgi:putative MFS transporter
MNGTSEGRPLTLEERMDRLPITRTHLAVYSGQGLGQVFDGYDVTIIGLAFAALIPALHLNFNDVGIISLSNNLGLFFGAILFGTIADYIGRKDAFQVTILIFGIGSALSALCTNTWELVIVRFVTGFGLGGEVPLVYSIMGEWTPKKHRGKILVIVGQLFATGIFLATAVASYLYPVYGWQIGFWIGAIPAVLFFVVRFFIPDSPRALIVRGKADEAQRVIERMEKLAGLEPAGKAVYLEPPPKPKVRLSALFTKRYRRTTVGIWASLFMIYWSQWGLNFLLAAMLSTVLGFKQQEALFMLFVINLPHLFYGWFMGWFWDWFGRRVMNAIYMIVMGVSTILIPLGAGEWWLMATFLLLQRFGQGCVSGVQLYAAELYDTDVRGSATGAANALGRFATAIAPLVGGMMLAAKLPISWVMWMLGLPPVVGIVFLLLTKETKLVSLESVARTKEELDKVKEIG